MVTNSKTLVYLIIQYAEDMGDTGAYVKVGQPHHQLALYRFDLDIRRLRYILCAFNLSIEWAMTLS